MWGDNGLQKTVSTPIANAAGINYRFAVIWKVQNTGAVGTVRVAWPVGLNQLSLVQSADTTFDGSDTYTPMYTNTQTVNGTTYNYADVILTNGQYFTLAVLVEHAPGGVITNLSYWYRADKQVQSGGNGTDVTQWTDYASNIPVNQVGTADLPDFKDGSFSVLNYNPGVNFTAGTQSLGNLSIQTLSSLNFNMFVATDDNPVGGGGFPRLFSVGRDNSTLNSTNFDSPGLWPDGTAERRNNVGG